MSTAQIKSAFVNELGQAGTCTLCTMQYVDGGKMQLVRFYVVRPGADEQIIEARVPRGSSLIEAARNEAAKFKESVA
jgi:hypothetical protein